MGILLLLFLYPNLPAILSNMLMMKGKNQKKINIKMWYVRYFLILMSSTFLIGLFFFSSSEGMMLFNKGNILAYNLNVLNSNQPIPFSHRKHNDVGLSCLDCHQMLGSGETAGFPSIDFCVACHQESNKKQSTLSIKLKTYKKEDKTIPWVRVYKLPDYIFMSHKKHVEAGATCKICHGPVSKRDILKKEVSTSMKFCMECHQSRGASIECNLCHELNQ